MTYRADYSISEDLLKEITEQGLDVMPELIRILINAAMQIERQRYLEGWPKSPLWWA